MSKNQTAPQCKTFLITVYISLVKFKVYKLKSWGLYRKACIFKVLQTVFVGNVE